MINPISPDYRIVKRGKFRKGDYYLETIGDSCLIKNEDDLTDIDFELFPLVLRKKDSKYANENPISTDYKIVNKGYVRKNDLLLNPRLKSFFLADTQIGMRADSYYLVLRKVKNVKR